MKKLLLFVLLCMAAQVALCQKKTKTTDTASNVPEAVSTTAFKVQYDYVFKRNPDGSLSTLHPVQLNGEIMGSGISFVPGTKFGGVDIGAYQGHDLMIDTMKSVVLIRKVL